MIYNVVAVHTLPVRLISLLSVNGRQAGVCCSSVEDQDSSGEGGLSSNWWVLGSQGCPLSAPGDATLQTLPQPALSPFGSQNRQPRHESENESASKNTEQSRYKSRKNDERRDGGKKSESEAQGRKQIEKEGQKRESKQHEDNETTSNDEGTSFVALTFTFRISRFVFILLTCCFRLWQIRNNRRDEYYEHAASPRTRNSFIQMTRATRTSWKNGPTLRQSTRLPAHQAVHPLFTLLRKSDTVTTGQRRRTQTKIGFYRALAKGKINVHVSVRGRDLE